MQVHTSRNIFHSLSMWLQPTATMHIAFPKPRLVTHCHLWTKHTLLSNTFLNHHCTCMHTHTTFHSPLIFYLSCWKYTHIKTSSLLFFFFSPLFLTVGFVRLLKSHLNQVSPNCSVKAIKTSSFLSFLACAKQSEINCKTDDQVPSIESNMVTGHTQCGSNENYFVTSVSTNKCHKISF